jgi:hypothetical protein
MNIQNLSGLLYGIHWMDITDMWNTNKNNNINQREIMNAGTGFCCD